MSMEKLDPKVDGATPSIVEQNVEELKRLLPEIVTESPGTVPYPLNDSRSHR